MRHRYSGRLLNRKSSHRTALFKNLSIALLKNEMIKTTLPKAKALRPVVEKLITLAKEDTLARRRLLFSRLRNDEVVAKLFTVIAPRSKNRAGGYLRILKCGYRGGDAAPMAIIQWVDSEQLQDLNN